MSSHTLFRDAAVLLSVAAPADLVRVLATARAPGTVRVTPRVFTWGLPVAALGLGGLGYAVSGRDVPWVWPGAVAVLVAVAGALVAFGGEVALAAAPLLRRGRRPVGLSVHRAFTDAPAVLAVSTGLTAVGEEIIYRGLWVGVLVGGFGAPVAVAVAVAAVGYAVNHWYLGTGVVRQKVWSGLVYGAVYAVSGGALLAAVLAHVLHNVIVAGLAARSPAPRSPVRVGA